MSHQRLNVLSWTTPFLAVAVVVYLFTSSIVQAQAPLFSDPRAKEIVQSQRSKTSQQMICQISGFFSIDANEQVNAELHIEGRGLASCKNDQGFSTDVPVSAEIDARAIGSWANAGELSFSANSSSFIVNREIGQLQDKYTVKTYASDLSDKNSPTLLFGGDTHNLMIELKFSSSTDAFQKIAVTGMSLRFDEAAPTLD